MAIRVDMTKQQLANQYAMLGTFFGLATADPGTMAEPASEASGPSYARVATTWEPGSTPGVVQGAPCTVLAPADVYRFALLCSDATGFTMIDNCAIANTTLSGVGQIVLTPMYTQS